MKMLVGLLVIAVLLTWLSVQLRGDLSLAPDIIWPVVPGDVWTGGACYDGYPHYSETRYCTLGAFWVKVTWTNRILSVATLTPGLRVGDLILWLGQPLSISRYGRLTYLYWFQHQAYIYGPFSPFAGVVSLAWGEIYSGDKAWKGFSSR